MPSVCGKRAQDRAAPGEASVFRKADEKDKRKENKMFRPRLYVCLLFLFAFVSGLVACSSPADGQAGSTPAPRATPATSSSTASNTPIYKVGAQVPVGSWMITIQAYSSTGDTNYTPKAGYSLLVFTISQQNRGSQPATANGAADWSLQDSSRTTFALVTQSGYGTFASQSVEAGQTATGTLVYEVPTNTQHFLLTFNSVTDGTQASWDVSPGQALVPTA
jgi:hypothetical protein